MNSLQVPPRLLATRLAILLCLLVPAGAALADTETAGDAAADEAREILEKADAAIKAVHGVRYKATQKPGGIATNFMGDVEGEGVMVGWNDSLPQKFYTRVTVQRPGSDPPVKLEGGGDGDSYFVIDHQTKKAYEDMDPSVLGSNAQTLQSLGMVEFVHEAPFDDELNADVAELQGTETIGGEECYKVRVVYSGNRGESTWYFSKDDLLPRRRVRHFSTPNGDGTLEITVSALEIDPEVDPGLFKLDLPEGYEQIDDFAP